MTRKEILQMIEGERERQIKLAHGGDTDGFDKGNSRNDWIAYIIAYAGRASEKVFRNEREGCDFKEYMIKWVLMVYNDNLDKRLSSEDLNKIFQNSLQKGEDIYGKFSHFGLYSYKENGLMQVIKYLLKKEFLTILEDRSIRITEKGEFIYKYFYSGQLLEDIKDPFDFFFEHRHDTLNLLNKKKEIMQKFNNLHK